jgi:sugar/nucleoside kinase (ribokinase family)
LSEPEAELEDGEARGRLVSFGGLLADLVVGVEAVPRRGEDALARDFTQTVGGGFAVLAAAARSGMATALAGVLGDDAIADAARRALREEGVELLLPEPRAGGSGLCLVLVDAGGERTMVTVEGVESRLRPEDFAAIRPAPDDVVYVSGYELLYPHGGSLADWVAEARPASLIFDPGPLIAEIDPGRLAGILAATSWLSLNAAEATQLTDEADPAAAAKAALLRLPDPHVDGPKTGHIDRFSARQHGVVVRTGAEGCVVLADGGRPVAVPGFAVEAVDTTGAGDTHVGAFVAALARGLDPAEACRWANAAAALVVAGRGQVSPPRIEELRRILGAQTSSW